MSGFTMSEEALQMCETCGIIDDCQPFGKNYEYVCYSCGLKDPETTSDRIAESILQKINNARNNTRNNDDE
jgi:hypothetical protein